MELEEGLDTGPVYARARVAIGAEMTPPTSCGAAGRRRRAAAGRPPVVARARGAAGRRTASPPTRPRSSRTSFGSIGSRPGRRDCSASIRLGRAWTTFRGQAPARTPRPIGRRPVRRRASSTARRRRRRRRRCRTASRCSPRGAAPQTGDGVAQRRPADAGRATRIVSNDDPRRVALARLRPDRGGRVRQPRVAADHRARRARPSATATSSPSSSTARRGCAAPVTG